MYRACRWTTSASRAIRDSSPKPDEKLLSKYPRSHLEFRRNNAVSAGIKTFQLLKIVGSGIVAAGATVGVGIFYAGRDDKVRSEIEEKLPVSKTVLTAIYGDLKVQEKTDEKMERLPLNRQLQKLPGASAVQNKFEKDESAIEKDASELNVEEKKQDARNNFVVITTIDDQAAVSSIDLDIGNTISSREKKAIKKPKNEKKVVEQEKEKEVEKEGTEASIEKVTEGEKTHPDFESTAVTEIAEEIKNEEISQSVVANELNDVITPEASPLISETEQMPTEEIAAVIEDVPIESAPVEVIPQIDAEQIVMEDDNELSEIGDNTSMEVLIQTYVDKLQLLRDMTLEKQTKASGQIREYITQLDKALKTEANENSFDQVWKATSDLEHESQTSMDDAKSLEMKMQASIEAIHEMIQASKKNAMSQIAEEAQEIINNASIDLQQATDDVKKACEELASFDMSNFIKDAKEKIEDHLQGALSVLSDEATGDSAESVQLPVKDVMMAYALKKIDYLKDAIESVKKEEKERTEALLKLLRDEEEARTQARLESEAERLQKHFEIESGKKEAELSGYYENEIKKQLKRQSAAHREHLNDVLKTQSDVLALDHQQNLDKAISEQKAVHVDELSRVAAHLKGVESMIDSVVDVESKNRERRELWLAVQSLGSVLNEEAEKGRTRNLLPEIMSIYKLSENHPSVKLVLSTIPETAAVLGVNTEEELKKRFAGVKNICKRVAMVGEKQGSLWTYALSAIRSFLVIETAAKHDTVSEIDPESISTYDTLAKAQGCIDNGDLELAVKFMSLLKGVPRKLASDWLRESRSYLEARLASDFLLAYVSSEGTFES